MRVDKLKYLICVAGLLMHTSCYQEIDLDKYKDNNGANLLTINSIINPDSTICVAATRPYFFSDYHVERDYVENLNIELRINGKDAVMLSYDADSRMYRFPLKPQEGDEVSLCVNYRGEDVTCRDIVPKKIKIEEINAVCQGPVSINTDKDYFVHYDITFTDIPGEKNYYFLDYDVAGLYDLSIGERLFSNEYLFQQLAEQVSSIMPGWEPYSPQGLPFSDKGIDGQTYTLKVGELIQSSSLLFYGNSMTMNRRFSLYAISEDYYNYLVSVICNSGLYDEGLHAGLIDLGVTEPSKYFTNINGGVGIFAAYSREDVILEVLDLIGPFPR